MKNTLRAAGLKIICISLVANCVSIPFQLYAGEAGGFIVHKDLVYSENDRELTLDLFLPKKRNEPVPCVMVFQGGGFNAQDGQKFRPFALYLAEHGLAAALVAYRGRPDHTYLDTVADTKAAVRYIRKFSNQYGIDPERIGAMGRSAGGTLAGLLAVTGGLPEFEGRGGHPEYSSRIQAAVAYAGVFDFVARFTDVRHIALQPNVKTKIGQNGEWVGSPFASDNRDWLRASAINHADPEDPPMLFLHCKNDPTVPWRQSQEMYETMKTAGADASLIYYETGGHGFKDLGEAPMAEMVQFFRETLSADR